MQYYDDFLPVRCTIKGSVDWSSYRRGLLTGCSKLGSENGWDSEGICGQSLELAMT